MKVNDDYNIRPTHTFMLCSNGELAIEADSLHHATGIALRRIADGQRMPVTITNGQEGALIATVCPTADGAIIVSAENGFVQRVRTLTWVLDEEGKRIALVGLQSGYIAQW